MKRKRPAKKTAKPAVLTKGTNRLNGTERARPRRVIIGTPTHDGTVEVWYANSILYSYGRCLVNSIVLDPLYMAYDSLIQNARNDLVAAAIKGDYDDLIFIDADQDWNPDWILKLLAHPVDVVGGAVRKKTDKEERYNVVSATLPIPVDQRTGLMIVDAVGTGFLRLSKRALHDLWNSADDYTCQGKQARWIFDLRPVNGVLVGEDVLLCQKLRQLGYAIHVDPTMTCGHIGKKRWQGNFATWYEGYRSRTGAPASSPTMLVN